MSSILYHVWNELFCITFDALHFQSTSKNQLNEDCIKPYNLIIVYGYGIYILYLYSFMAKLQAPENRVYAETLAPITLVDAALFRCN